MGRAAVVDGLLVGATLVAGALATLTSARGRALPTNAGQRRSDRVREQQNEEARDRSRHGFILRPINGCPQTDEGCKRRRLLTTTDEGCLRRFRNAYANAIARRRRMASCGA